MNERQSRFQRNLGGLASGAATSSPNPPSDPSTPSRPVQPPASTAAGKATAVSSRPATAIGDLVSQGAPAMTEREIHVSVDPAKCRPWKYHDRKESNLTLVKLQSLIDSIRTEKQKRPALARRLTGDPQYEYELIYGVRRQRACGHLKIHLKIVVKELTDQQAAVEMEIENREREDITAMERAMSWARQLKDKLFPTQEKLAEAMGLSQPRISQAVSAASILEIEAIARLFREPADIPVKRAVALSIQLQNEKRREAIVKAANHLYERKRHLILKCGSILAQLSQAPERSTQDAEDGPRFSVVEKEVNFGTDRRMKVKRNARGKVTFTFPQGFQKDEADKALTAVKQGIEALD